MIPAQTLGRGIKDINVVAKLKPGKSPLVPYRHDKTVYDYTYTVENNTEVETRVWVDKMYYRPISRDEVNKNKLLEGKNNPGYN
jgi:starch-binding outer membrane protein, SusD/RagB family